jgi:hypothetical protein
VLTKWVGDSPSWASTSTLEAFLHLLARILLLPFLALLLIVAPFSSLANRLSSPVNRLVSHLAAYLVFLALVTVQGHVTKNNYGRTATGQTRDHILPGIICNCLVFLNRIGTCDWSFSARTGVKFDHEAVPEGLQGILQQNVEHVSAFFKNTN